ncbi:MAG: hypothetical protein JNJ47_04710, partial [Alphaproteobacteria bacterium]|nr:hypothetical protein [Alphaproteobacteria bacterium]
YEQTGEDKKQTSKYISSTTEKVSPSTIEKIVKNPEPNKKGIASQTWNKISNRLSTSEKVCDCLKESNFTHEQRKKIFDILTKED